MNNIFSFYTKYRNHIDEYGEWRQQSLQTNNINPSSLSEEFKSKAKAISEPLLLLDSYEHEKAEDSETFFQTCNIELMSIAGLLSSLPAAITKAVPFLEKHSDKNQLIKKTAKALNKYNSSQTSILGKTIPVSKALTLITAVGSGLFFANGIKKSMQSQLGIIRKASFDASQSILDDPKLFAQLTQEQEAEVNSIVQYEEKRKSVVDKLTDRVNISSAFQAVSEYNQSLKDYETKKNDYLKNANSQSDCALTPQQSEKAKKDKQFFSNLVKSVEHDVLEDLRKVETISNISYSSLFTGGFLEYLITDKLADVLKIQNKALRTIVKIGVPLFTYFVLNKNISNLENKVICATKYKHLKKFGEHPEIYPVEEDNKKQSFIDFIKTTYKDLKDYEKFSQEELPKLKARLDAKKQIKLTPEQLEEAKLLKNNTLKVINNQREHLYQQSVGIKSLSETILGPLDILATAIGGGIGHHLSKNLSGKKMSALMTGIGAVIAFIPAAIAEAKLTKEQKLSEKIASMLAVKDMQNERFFTPDKTVSKNYSQIPAINPDIFKDFK